jgi:hypothetical protein
MPEVLGHCLRAARKVIWHHQAERLQGVSHSRSQCSVRSNSAGTPTSSLGRSPGECRCPRHETAFAQTGSKSSIWMPSGEPGRFIKIWNSFRDGHVHACGDGACSTLPQQLRGPEPKPTPHPDARDGAALGSGPDSDRRHVEQLGCPAHVHERLWLMVTSGLSTSEYGADVGSDLGVLKGLPYQLYRGVHGLLIANDPRECLHPG